MSAASGNAGGDNATTMKIAREINKMMEANMAELRRKNEELQLRVNMAPAHFKYVKLHSNYPDHVQPFRGDKLPELGGHIGYAHSCVVWEYPDNTESQVYLQFDYPEKPADTMDPTNFNRMFSPIIDVNGPVYVSLSWSNDHGVDFALYIDKSMYKWIDEVTTCWLNFKNADRALGRMCRGLNPTEMIDNNTMRSTECIDALDAQSKLQAIKLHPRIKMQVRAIPPDMRARGGDDSSSDS